MHNKLTYFVIPALALGLLSPIAFGGPGAHGPDGEHLDGAVSASGGGLARLPDGSVNVPKQAQRSMAIRTVMAVENDHPLTVELNGRVAIDPNAGGRVQAPFAGRIEAGPKGLPIAGQRVEKGQILLRIKPVSSAIDRANQEAQLADLRANRILAEQRVIRLQSLEGSVPQKDIDASRAELSSLKGRERAVSSSVVGSETITASASGIVATANVLSGQIVEARDVLYEIIDPNRMIVEASSTDVALASRINQASLVSHPLIDLILLGGGRSLRDGALPISFQAQGKDMSLAIGQPVTVIAKLTEKIKGIAIPAEALVRNPENQPIVWIKAGAERFIAQKVEARALDANTIVVVKGLAPENRVVVSGTALINQIR